MKEATLSADATGPARLALRSEPIVLVVMTALVFGYLLSVLPGIPNDYDEHSAFARNLAEGTPSPLVRPHILFQLAAIGVQRLTLEQVSYETAGSIAGLLSYIGTALLLYRVFLASLPHRRGLAAGLALALLLVSHIFLLSPEKPYIGYISPNTFHNPTAVIARPFALALLLVSMPFLQRRRMPAGQTSLLAVVTLLALLAKPNYALCLLPALALVALFRLLKRRPVAALPLIAGVAVPAAALLALQFAVSYQTLTDSGLAFAPLAFLHLQEPSDAALLVKFLASIAFPAAVYLLCLRQARRDLLLNVAWLAFLIGCAQNYLLVETGERMGHGNWIWGAQLGLFVLFVVSLQYVIQNYRRLSRGRRLTAFAIFALHLVSGVAFYGVHLSQALSAPR